MATIKSFTDLEQSKKLAEILPLESADMFCADVFNKEKETHSYNFHILSTWGCNTFEELKDRENKFVSFTPVWSLAALFDILPVIIGDVLSENSLRLRIDKSETNFNVWYENLDSGMVEEGLDIIKSNAVDAYYKMIIKLYELKML